MSKIPIYLITGFLGSGKTTLLSNILRSDNSDKKIAVVQNEFASHNFDGIELKRESNKEFDLLEINNGSAFCVCLLSNFISSFDKFIDKYNPDIVFFEASGLSDPISVGEIFNSPQLGSKVFLAASICVVDATSFLKLEKLQQRMKHQVQIAHIILLNKTDLCTDYSETLKKIKLINPNCLFHQTSFCNVDIQNLITINTKQQTNAGTFQFSAEDMGRPDISSVVFKSTTPLPERSYKAFLDTFEKGVIRVKGFLWLDSGKTLSIQYEGNNINIKAVDETRNQTEIIVMGYDISPEKIKNYYQQQCT